MCVIEWCLVLIFLLGGKSKEKGKERGTQNDQKKNMEKETKQKREESVTIQSHKERESAEFDPTKICCWKWAQIKNQRIRSQLYFLWKEMVYEEIYEILKKFFKVSGYI